MITDFGGYAPIKYPFKIRESLRVASQVSEVKLAFTEANDFTA